MEEICSTDFTGVEQSLFGKVQERPIPKIKTSKKTKKKIKRKNGCGQYNENK